MTTLTEKMHEGEAILSEANGHRSRDNVTMLSGSGVVKAGTVVGKITASGKYQPSPATDANGSGVANAVTIADVDATSADAVVAVIARDAEVNGDFLTYEATVDTAPEIAAKAVQLAAVGIIVRN